MIKASVMYPNQENAHFDHGYYRDKHMPLVQERLGAGCSYYTIDKGLTGGSPDEPAAYVAMCHIFSPSLDTFLQHFRPHSAEIVADVPNFTDIAPTMQISEVVVDAPAAP